MSQMSETTAVNSSSDSNSDDDSQQTPKVVKAWPKGRRNSKKMTSEEKAE